VSEPGAEREQRILQLVGLAQRAGRAAVGTQAVRDAARNGDLSLVVLARDATDNARRRLGALSGDVAVPIIRAGSGGALGHAAGRNGAVVVGIRDRGFGARIEETAAGDG